ncbi:MAG: S8 family serine peptidase [Micrococcales bacterium]|nr:S8 family serine peptidase [Micrococcales bacterium]
METSTSKSASRRTRVLLAAAAAAAVALSQMAVPSTANVTAPTVSHAQSDLRDEALAAPAVADPYSPDQIVTVIVDLSRPATMDVPGLVANYDSSSSTADEAKAAAYRESLTASQTAVRQAIAGIYPDAQFRYSYTNLLNGFAAKLPYGKIALVEALPGVEAVYLAQTYTVDALTSLDVAETTSVLQTDSGSTSLMGLGPAWAAGYTGAGKVVAVFDTGLRVSHEAFSYMDPDIVARAPDNYKTKAGVQAIIDANPTMNLFKHGWGSWFHDFADPGFRPDAQAAAHTGAFWYNEKIPFHADYILGNFDSRPSQWAACGSCGHGTHVAGIAAANPGPNSLTGIKGSAPDAQIMFFKIFENYDSFLQESDEAVFAALDDAVTLGVNAFNLSLGIPNGHSTANTYAQAGYQKAYNRARAHGISVQLSSGNDNRDTNSGAIAGLAASAYRPNAGTSGFSGSLFGPMTVASANNGGHAAGTLAGLATTTMAFTKASDGTSAQANVAGPASGDFTNNPNPSDWYADPPGLQGKVPGPLPLVNVGSPTEANIIAAGGTTTLTNALAGKVAIVDGPITTVTQPDARVWAQLNAQGRAAQILLTEAHPAAVIVCGTGTVYYPESFINLNALPFIGNIAAATCTTIRSTLTANPAGVNVSFTSARPTFTAGNLSDSGPVSSTSWGVTEALRLKPDIMAPGGSIWSSTWNNDFSYGNMSGTSMASPNSEGAMILVQQIIDKRIIDGDITGIARGTQAYSNLVDQFSGSNAKAYSASGTYFSPRRQGTGMIRVDKVLNSQVSLRSLVAFNPDTGEAPRAKVDLGDKLGDTFTVSFALDNWSTTARTFDVSAVVQTETTSTNAQGRPQLPSGNSTTAAEIARLATASMKVAATGTGVSVTGADNNVNKYATGNAPAVLTVPAKSSTTVTITVELGTMTALDAVFRNGLFLDGYVFFDARSPATEAVSIPFMGFRGDWNASPALDPMTAYQDRTGKPVTDIDYPTYHVSALATLAGTAERVVGANAYQGTAWAGYRATNSVSPARTFLDTQRSNGNLTAAKTAFSPNGDGQWDIVYANLAVLRDVKALEVLIRDSSGAVVKTLGPDYEFFELLTGDGNGTQQIAATYGTKYQRKMAWDGTDASGARVPDGSYVFEVRGVLEKAFLEDLGYPSTDAAVGAYLSGLAVGDSRLQMQQFAVKVDTVPPAVSWEATSPTVIRVVASDDSAIQSMGVYINGTLSGSTAVIGTSSVDRTFTVPAGTNMANVTVQAVDYAGNLTAQALAPANSLKAALQVVVNTYHNLYEVNAAAFTPESFVPLADALTLARWWIAADMVSQSVFDQCVAALADAALKLRPVVDYSSFDAALAAADMMLANPSKYVSTHMPALAAQVFSAKMVRASATSQAVVDQAFADLMAAIWLVVEIGDTSGLAALVMVANGMDPLRFTPTSWARVTAALAVGNALLASAEPRFDDVDAAFVALADALEALVLRTAKAGLKSAIDVADSIMASIDAYVASSVAGLPAELAAAKAVYADGDATAAEVSAAQAGLLTAIAAARLKATGSPILPASVASALTSDAKAAGAALSGKASVTKVFAKAKAAKIAGKTVVGSKLKAKVAAWSPKAKLSFQWYRNGKAIAKATKATYTVKATDKGAKLTVKVTGKKAGYATKTKTSKAKVIK